MCAAGLYSEVAEQLTCTACVAGLYSDQITQFKADVCKPCGKGKIAPLLVGNSACVKCPAGTFLKDTSGSVDLHDKEDDCTKCAKGKYTPFKGHASECFECLSAKVAGTQSSEATLQNFCLIYRQWFC